LSAKNFVAGHGQDAPITKENEQDGEMNTLLDWFKGQDNLHTFHGDERMTESFRDCNLLLLKNKNKFSPCCDFFLAK
jgi:hypothetical protein